MWSLRWDFRISAICFGSLSLLTTGCSKVEAQGTECRIGCYRVTTGQGVGAFSTLTSGTVQVAALSFQVEPTPPGATPWEKITTAKVSVYRDLNGDEKKDPNEPGTDLQVGSADGPPTDNAMIGAGAVSVGTGVPGPVVVEISVGTASGKTVSISKSKIY